MIKKRNTGTRAEDNTSSCQRKRSEKELMPLGVNLQLHIMNYENLRTLYDIQTKLFLSMLANRQYNF